MSSAVMESGRDKWQLMDANRSGSFPPSPRSVALLHALLQSCPQTPFVQELSMPQAQPGSR